MKDLSNHASFASAVHGSGGGSGGTTASTGTTPFLTLESHKKNMHIIESKIGTGTVC
jgi:hypothetical protein